MKTANVDIDDVLIDCQSLWKVFGDKSAAAMKSIKERGLGKKEVLQEFNCVVGVSNASIQVRRGEIFCITVAGLPTNNRERLRAMWARSASL